MKQDILKLCRDGNIAAVRDCLEAGDFNPDELNENGGYNQSAGFPLIIAIRKRNVELARLLLEHGANPDIVSYADCDGKKSPYVFAVSFFLDEFVELMKPYRGKFPVDAEKQKERWLEAYGFVPRLADAFDAGWAYDAEKGWYKEGEDNVKIQDHHAEI